MHPQRQNLEKLMRATLTDSAHWDYRAIRPLYVYPSWKKGMHVNSDCSWGVKLLCRWCRPMIKDDPTGGNYDGYGNSDSIAVHLRHAAHASDLQVGDIVVSFDPGHAAMVLKPGSNPTMWSDGHEGAPNSYPLSADTRRKVYCVLNVGTYKMTPADKLRAQEGYWSWLCWTLGEGDWKKYPPTAEKVRPNVPEKIDASWWQRREKFLRGRSDGNPQRFKGGK